MKHVKRLFKIGVLLGIIGIVVLIGLYVFAYFTDPIALNTANSYYIYDSNDNVIYQGSNNSEWVSLDNIDSKFIEYIVSVEDKHFYQHKGFDILRILKSLYLNMRAGKIVGGASSISQQYVKNLFLEFDQTWERKIEEAFLTIRLETHYSKKEILEGYLNTIYFGQGIYGVKDAAQYYFNKDISDITIEQAITLAGIPKSPNNYNPISNKDSYLKRVKIVANFLKDNEIISEEEFNALNFNDLEVYGKHQNNNLDTLMYYQDAVIAELKNIKNIPKSLLDDGGLRIYTNLDIDAQTAMENSIKENNVDDNNQIASVIVNPNTGGVVALAGGKNYTKSQYNRVTQAKRQVGSTIKPFLYYAALNNGMTSASTFKSEKTSFVFGENKTYTPTNYGDLYGNKDISMAAALAYSDNIFAVKTHLFLGENTLVDTLKTCGLKESLLPNPSLALGAKEINMLDYATAYTSLASGGLKRDLFFIRRIEDINGNKIYERTIEDTRVLDESITYIVNEMMTNTYNYNFVDYYSPTVLYLNGKLSHKYALKSGTTDNDYWLSGYNKNALMLIWAGNDLNEETPKTYSKIIKNIWLDTMETIEKDMEDVWYTKPDNVVAVPMDPITGKYNTKSKNLFYFLEGTELAYIN
ncbi:MAG: transglycosylase domain-containing protein [Bacilli bacterium]|nr:transglycosylase domain-containing protein [Bacilli bacterium]